MMNSYKVYISRKAAKNAKKNFLDLLQFSWRKGFKDSRGQGAKGLFSMTLWCFQLSEMIFRIIINAKAMILEYFTRTLDPLNP